MASAFFCLGVGFVSAWQSGITVSSADKYVSDRFYAWCVRGSH